MEEAIFLIGIILFIAFASFVWYKMNKETNKPEYKPFKDIK